MGVNSRVHMFNVELPPAGKNLLSADLKPIIDNSELRIHCAFSKTGKLSMARTHSGATIVEDLNGGNNLAADTGYTIIVPTRFFTSYNLRYSADHGMVSVIQIEEISP